MNWKRFYIFLLLIPSVVYSIEYNPWNLDIMERIVHRKNISHIIIEPRPDHYRLTFILSDRFPYNYKSRQGFFFIRFTDEDLVYKIAKDFDKHLDTGKEIYFRLNGSEIVYYRFLE
jgi:hypothetical protein